jgi:hypothetical protein
MPAQPAFSIMTSPQTATPGDAMETSLSHSLVRLGAEELLSIEAVRGGCVVVFHGKVWITQHSDARDYVVSSGETFTFDHPGLALVEALQPTSLVVLVEATSAPDPIGYEAAWPQTVPAQAQWTPEQVRSDARVMRARVASTPLRGFADVARRSWSTLAGSVKTSDVSLRQAA